MDLKNVKVISFDADDTLWINETYFKETEAEFCELMEPFVNKKDCSERLLHYEIGNLKIYGYGIKGYILSMIEAAISISEGKVSQDVIHRILEMGKRQLEKPVILLDGVEEVLQYFSQKGIRLIVATKGDLLDQENKLRKSSLEQFFHHIEIMSDKKQNNYLKLINHLDIEPEEFLMVGNSLKSDVLPVLELGGYAVHVPFHTTWEHETVDEVPQGPRFAQLDNLSGLKELYENL